MVMRDLNMGTKAGLAVISDKWSALILLNLTGDYQGFMTLRESVRGIGTFKLLIKLATLTRLGLVADTSDYQYKLTLDGQYFQQVLLNLDGWGDRQLRQTTRLSLTNH
ncbi:winged helix-turn-helix transcriptional regulator [Secundilactobacillus similis DSM 23365 = JCM 2765]|jgi:DNA-binding HxlR family transcriptional regulator|uniref:HTH hxlR-type domain-containing protein n=2 Tax=Secundilactobacillus similis TaxID=414682 RepID=A0A0R2F9H1_9LACO|nr:winged helix-turn-helix transcriptional regulator [Secundilactobacillus similis]KRN25001.1 hypothetical protein FD14_GL000473 [Secundilactobacillus similis DSM 23365 = JCM 2765]